MTPNLKISIPFSEFQNSANSLIQQANLILENESSDEVYLATLRTFADRWIKDVVTLLEDSFNIKNNSFVTDFQSATSGVISNVATNTYHFHLRQLKETIKAKNFSLWGSLRILEVMDCVIVPNNPVLDKRRSLTIEDKLSILLEKLYDLYDDYYYPINDILSGNGIIQRRYNEYHELAKILEDRGLVKIIPGVGDTNAQLTTEGAMYVENNRIPLVENYDEHETSPNEMQERIDEIIEQLRKLGDGQEILFDELQELKEMYSKVNKRNWAQLLKGKLIDLALGKLIDNDTLQFIYQSLTDHQFFLPK